MKHLKLFFGIVLVLAIALAAVFSYQKSRIVEEVNLTPELRAEYEKNLLDMDLKIKNVLPPEKPDIDFFVEKARYQQYLGRISDAIDTLLEAFKYYENTSVGWNNIAKLYEHIGDYKSAIFFYNKLIDVFARNEYYLNVAWDYYKLGRYGTAYEAYGRYAQLAHGNDAELLQLLKAKIK